MELNRPVEILTALVVLALIVGFVIWNSALTVQGAVDLAFANPLIAVPVGWLSCCSCYLGRGVNIRMGR